MHVHGPFDKPNSPRPRLTPAHHAHHDQFTLISESIQVCCIHTLNLNRRQLFYSCCCLVVLHVFCMHIHEHVPVTCYVFRKERLLRWTIEALLNAFKRWLHSSRRLRSTAADSSLGRRCRVLHAQLRVRHEAPPLQVETFKHLVHHRVLHRLRRCVGENVLLRRAGERRVGGEEGACACTCTCHAPHTHTRTRAHACAT